MIKFENTYNKLPQRFFSRVRPAYFKDPELIKFNFELAQELGMKIDQDIEKIFSGQLIPEGADPLAMAYAGFQFGHPVPELGDGRAMLLGEVNGFDLHLKGAGQTAYSRRGDGLSALGPVIREYIVSESMHALGVSTTRALCAVKTNESVYRQFGEEPGGVFTRVASSHIRVGTFQYFAFKNDYEGIEVLLEYTLKRHYPELLKLNTTRERALEFLKEFAKRQGDLIARWSGLGFIHGVMNTDNCHVGGITIDYGPCAFLEDFSFQKVFSSIDQRGRYSFFNQVPIIQWNILRLAECFIPFIGDGLPEELKTILNDIPNKRMEAFAEKMGINDFRESDTPIVMSYLTYLEKEKLDFTQSFRKLSEMYQLNQFEGFDFHAWKERVNSPEYFDSKNPWFIPRNHQVQKAIDQIYLGDKSHFEKMLLASRNPYLYQEEYAEFYVPAQSEEMVTKTYCGT